MTIFKGSSRGTVRKFSAGCALALTILALLPVDAGAAERLVDPDSVAPEYRAAAEKRRGEQLKLMQCSKKVDETKVPRRDRAARISECLDKGS